jgi:drug/metabolite transporter (DMT)-like permease
VTVLLALLAAVANATASVLQRKAAGRVPDVKSLRLALIGQLLHYPVWFAGVGAVIAGFLLQALALSGGTVAMVQPLLVAELPVTLVLSALVFGSRLGRNEWLAVLALSGGLALVLGTAAPAAGSTQLSAARWAVGILVTGTVIGLLVLRARRCAGGARAAYFGIAAGATFGLTAALMKAMTARFERGFALGFGGWQLYLMIACGAAAMYLLQCALQAGRLAVSQPGLTITDPVVAGVWGVALFGEAIRSGPFVIGEIVGLAALLAGMVALARSPLLSAEAGAHEQDPASAADASQDC